MGRSQFNLIPKQLSLEALFAIAKKHGLNRYRLIYILGHFCQKFSQFRTFNYAWNRFSSRILKKKFKSKYADYIRALISEGILECDGSYRNVPWKLTLKGTQIGGFCMSYRLGTKYRIEKLGFQKVIVPWDSNRVFEEKIEESGVTDREKNQVALTRNRLKDVTIKSDFWIEISRRKSAAIGQMNKAIREATCLIPEKLKKLTKKLKEKCDHEIARLESIEQNAEALESLAKDLKNADVPGWCLMDNNGRIHTPLVNFCKEFRHFLRINGQIVISIDLKNSQPAIIASLIKKTMLGQMGPEEWYDLLDQATKSCKKPNTRIVIANRESVQRLRERATRAKTWIAKQREINGRDWHKWPEETKKFYTEARRAITRTNRLWTQQEHEKNMRRQAVLIVKYARDPENTESINRYVKDAESGRLYEEVAKQGGPEAENWLKQDRGPTKQHILKVHYDRNQPKPKDWRKEEKTAKTEIKKAKAQNSAGFEERYAAVAEILKVMKQETHGAAAAIAQRVESEVMRPLLEKTPGTLRHDSIETTQEEVRETKEKLQKALVEAGIAAKVSVEREVIERQRQTKITKRQPREANSKAMLIYLAKLLLTDSRKVSFWMLRQPGRGPP